MTLPPRSGAERPPLTPNEQIALDSLRNVPGFVWAASPRGAKLDRVMACCTVSWMSAGAMQRALRSLVTKGYAKSPERGYFWPEGGA